MPFYSYEHIGRACSKGKKFSWLQSMKDAPLEKCPECKGKVRRLISRASVSVVKSDRELRNLGFRKLVRRDKGVYEDVTRGDKDKPIIDVNEP